MSQAEIQAQIYHGFGIAASILGVPCIQSRSPDGHSSPINIGAPTNAYFRAPSGPFVTPLGYGKMALLGGFDPTPFLVGDYLTDPDGVSYFIASLEAMSYPLMVRCNQRMNFYRPAASTPAVITQPTQPGNYPPQSDFFGGDLTSTEIPLMLGWNASVIQGTKGEKGEVALPGDIRVPWVQILIPDGGVVQFMPGDQAVDFQPVNMRYTISGVERTALGWRLTAMMEVA